MHPIAGAVVGLCVCLFSVVMSLTGISKELRNIAKEINQLPDRLAEKLRAEVKRKQAEQNQLKS